MQADEGPMSEGSPETYTLDVTKLKSFIAECVGINNADVRVQSEHQINIHSAGNTLEYHLTYTSEPGPNKEATGPVTGEADKDVHVVLHVGRSDIIKATLDLLNLKPMTFGEESDNKKMTPIPYPEILKTGVWPEDLPEVPEQHSFGLFSVPNNARSLSSAFPTQTPPDSPLRQEADRQLGAIFSSIHKTFNLWYGIPSQPADWSECLSWQECFTALFHTALSSAERAGIVKKELVEQLQRAMFHAVAYFLFDDVEVPSLVYNPGLEYESDIFVSDSVRDVGGGNSKSGTPDIVAMYGWTTALWGDPLMECALRTPSKAFLEGYGENPMVFERQETKKLWYLAYAALTSLVVLHRQKANSKTPGSSQVDGELAADAVTVRQGWDVESLKALLMQTAEKLKDAPCY